MAKNAQGPKDVVSNTAAWRLFEIAVMKALKKSNPTIVPNFKVNVGVSKKRKGHKFDCGSCSAPLLVECKRHTWTDGNNVPSAKLSVWNEAMFYFSCAPKKFRKMFVVLRDKCERDGETLAEYYIRHYEHMIPPDVEIWECEGNAKRMSQLFGPGRS